MATRMIVNGRIFMLDRKSAMAPKYPTEHDRALAQMPTRVTRARTAEGKTERREEILDTTAIPPHVERPRLMQHPDDGLTYRVVRKLRIQEEGWATAHFWMERYGLTNFAGDKGYQFIREWVHRGWLEAAMEEGSPTKRFRCLDEHLIYEQMWNMWRAKHSLGPGEKERIRKALLRLKPLFEQEAT